LQGQRGSDLYLINDQIYHKPRLSRWPLAAAATF
jgi:hypothetical protein